MVSEVQNLEIDADVVPGWERPVRIPEHIELTHADPPYAMVGAPFRVRLPFVLAREVTAGADLRLQLWGGRNNRRIFAGLPAPEDLAASLEDGTPVPIHASEPEGACQLTVPPSGMPAGTRLTISIGLRAGSTLCADDHHLYNKFFLLFLVPPTGPGNEPPPWSGGAVWGPQTWDRIVAACTMHVVGGPLHHLRACAPAAIRPGEPFTLLVRAEDEQDNLAHERPGNLEVLLDDVPLAITASPVPQSSCIALRLAVTREGVHRLLVREIGTGQEARANPLRCSTTATPVFHGMIHGHTEISDGTGTLTHFFRQLRHELLLDFCATADHDHRWETPEDFWQATCAAVKAHNLPGEFVTLLGYEWAKWRQNGDGDRNVYFAGDDRPIYRSDDEDFPTPTDLFRALAAQQEQAIVIPHHTAHGGNWCDWKEHDPARERLVEIFQCRGSYECAPEDGNPVPEVASFKAFPPAPQGYVRRALALGWRVGFTAGGDDHDGHWGTEKRLPHYASGMMSVEAPEKTREAIFAALYARRVVATTGPRILLTYKVNGHPLGSELSVSHHPELANRRTFTVECHSTAPIARLEIIRNNAIVHVVPGDGEDLSMTWDDVEHVEEAWLPPALFCDHPFLFYYLRLVQQDGEVAWASPLWIDP